MLALDVDLAWLLKPTIKINSWARDMRGLQRDVRSSLFTYS